MKTFVFLFLSLLVFAACDRTPAPAPAQTDAGAEQRAEQLRALDERMAQLQEAERRAAEREIAQTAEERNRVAAERDAIQRERDKLAGQRNEAERRAAQNQQAAESAVQRAARAEREAKEIAQRADKERGESTVDFFYSALEPHGEWVEVERLGYCWLPNAARNARWRPYTDGRWVFTDYGWTWKSNEPFGWAAYHYGRWTKVKRLGWVWVPGTEWGPAWVSWRRGSEYVGWAPLPPDAWSKNGFNEGVDEYYDIGPGSYTFVSADRLGEETYVERAVAPERNVTIINETVNVTNVTYTKVENTTVVFNGGPDFAEANERSTAKVPRLRVERVTEARRPAEMGKAELLGGVLRMAGPLFSSAKKQAATPAPAKVRQGRVQAAEVERGWADVPDQAVVQRVRAQRSQDARQAEERERSGRPAPARTVVAPPVRAAAPAAASATPKPADATPVPATPIPKPRIATPQPAPPTPATPKPPRATLPPAERSPTATPAERRPAPTPEPRRPATPAAASDPEPPRELAMPPQPDRPQRPARATPAQNATAPDAPVKPEVAPPSTPPREPRRQRPATVPSTPPVPASANPLDTPARPIATPRRQRPAAPAAAESEQPPVPATPSALLPNQPNQLGRTARPPRARASLPVALPDVVVTPASVPTPSLTPGTSDVNVPDVSAPGDDRRRQRKPAPAVRPAAPGAGAATPAAEPSPADPK